MRPCRHLRFVWWPDHGDAEADATEVSYLLEPLEEGKGVMLTVQERQVEGPAGVADAQASAVRAGCALDLPDWTAWDTRLAGAWAGVAGVARVRA